MNAKLLLASAMLSSVLIVSSSLAEDITLTTILPQTGMTANILRAKKGAVGDTYSDPATLADTAIPANSLLVEKQLGIGTTTIGSESLLEAQGSAAKNEALLVINTGAGMARLEVQNSSRAWSMTTWGTSDPGYSTSNIYHGALAGDFCIGDETGDGTAERIGGTAFVIKYAGAVNHVPYYHIGMNCNIDPQHTLEINGDLQIQGGGGGSGLAYKTGGGSWWDSSDIRLKKDVKTIKNALENMLKLRGVTYEWKEPAKHGNAQGAQMSMIAQEVEKVFPQWVGTDKDGYKTLGFTGFEALTVEAIRELKSENNALKARIAALEAKIR